MMTRSHIYQSTSCTGRRSSLVMVSVTAGVGYKQVTDSMLMNASFVYPENTPTTKEGYYYRTIFEKYFPKNAARSTVPGSPSVACSTAKAVEWDAEWSKNPDPSGRAALGIHAAAYEESKDVKTGNLVSDSIETCKRCCRESGCSRLSGMKKMRPDGLVGNPSRVTTVSSLYN